MTGMARVPLLIVGGGMAAARLIQELHQRSYAQHTVVVSEETYVGYNRVLLPQLLSGSCKEEALLNRQAAWRSAPWLELVTNTRVTDIAYTDRMAVLSNGRTIQFDQLVLAIGGHVPALTCPIDGDARVSYLRRLDDVHSLLEDLPRSVAIIGGGLLGLEAADALSAKGVAVTVLHRGSHLMHRQLDERAATILAQTLRANHIQVRLEVDIQQIVKREDATAVLLSDGVSIAVDQVIAANGVLPNPAPANGTNADVDMGDGVAVDEYLRTSHDNVFALGECARVNGSHVTLVDGVYAQAHALAATICGDLTAAVHTVPATRLKVRQPDVFAVGNTSPGQQQICLENSEPLVYRSLFVSRDEDQREVVSGAVLVGDTDGAKRLASHIGKPLGNDTVPDPEFELERLAFGQYV